MSCAGIHELPREWIRTFEDPRTNDFEVQVYSARMDTENVSEHEYTKSVRKACVGYLFRFQQGVFVDRDEANYCAKQKDPRGKDRVCTFERGFDQIPCG